MEKIFCVIGHPISHSMSPAMHNAVFESLGLNNHYTLFDVEPKQLGAALKGMKALGFGGINVTIPHKVSVIPFLDRLSDDARVIGAVNTIRLGEEVEGFNTDGIGALEALKKNDADPGGKRVLVLGSGGAARAIAITLALRAQLDDLTILGIERSEISRLIKDIGETGFSAKGQMMDKKTLRIEAQNADVIIHATPVGMRPRSDETLLKSEDMNREAALMDIVYNPLETMLMREAQKAGLKTVIGGVDMFVNQGAESLRIWLDIDPPVELMKKTVIKALRSS